MQLNKLPLVSRIHLRHDGQSESFNFRDRPDRAIIASRRTQHSQRANHLTVAADIAHRSVQANTSRFINLPIPQRLGQSQKRFLHRRPTSSQAWASKNNLLYPITFQQKRHASSREAGGALALRVEACLLRGERAGSVRSSHHTIGDGVVRASDIRATPTWLNPSFCRMSSQKTAIYRCTTRPARNVDSDGRSPVDFVDYYLPTKLPDLFVPIPTLAICAIAATVLCKKSHSGPTSSFAQISERRIPATPPLFITLRRNAPNASYSRFTGTPGCRTVATTIVLGTQPKRLFMSRHKKEPDPTSKCETNPDSPSVSSFSIARSSNSLNCRNRSSAF